MAENHIRENIKYLRAKLSMTQGEFGSLFGVSRDNIASYERGSEPKMEFIVRLVNYFPISYDDFIGTLLEDRFGPADLLYDGNQLIAEVNEPQQNYQPETEAEKGPGWQNIPVYELEATASLSSLFLEPQSFQPIDYFAASTLPRCDGGLRINGDGMAPVIKSGDIVFYKEVKDVHNAIVWGEMYLLSFELGGDEYIMVKYIHQSDRPGYVKLAGQNPHHAPKEIALRQIKALALVKANVRINTLR